jgi:drug/metabolite transporter (DMT)-like permease
LLRELLVPCSVFAIFIYTSARALRYISLPILSVIKSLAPMGIAATERILFNDSIHASTYLAMAIILVANLVTVLNDIEFSPVGYMWAGFNTIANILYVVSLRFCVSKNYKNGDKALHLNILLTAIVAPIAIAMGELPGFLLDFSLTSARFRLLFFFSCVLAAGIGASVFWVLQSTSGSTLSFIGAANKVSIILLGAILFEVHISAAGWLGIFVSVLGSIAFTISKLRASTQENTTKSIDRGDKGGKAPLLAKNGDENLAEANKEHEKP